MNYRTSHQIREHADRLLAPKLEVETLAPVHGKPVAWSTFQAALNTLGEPGAR